MHRNMSLLLLITYATTVATSPKRSLRFSTKIRHRINMLSMCSESEIRKKKKKR